MDEKIDYSSNIAYVESIQNFSDEELEELEKIEQFDPYRELLIKNNIDYRNQLKKAKALYDANAYARVVVDTIETDNWCQRIEKEVTAEAEKDKRTKIESFKDAKNFMENNSNWKKNINSSQYLEDFYQSQVRLGKSSKEISDLIDKRINESSIADQYYKLAKEINKPIDLEPFMKKRGILDAWKVCLRCGEQEQELLERYDKHKDTFYGSKDEIAVAKARKKLNDFHNATPQEQALVSDAFHHPLPGLMKNVEEAEKKVPELIVMEYAQKTAECNKIGPDSTGTLDERFGDTFVDIMDVCGFVPILSTPSSLILAGYYAAKGELSDSALSLAGIVPGGGVGKKIVKGAAWTAKKARVGAALFNREVKKLSKISHAKAEALLNKTPGLTKEMRDKLLEQAAKIRKLSKEAIEKAKEKISAVKGAPYKKETGQFDNVCHLCNGKLK